MATVERIDCPAPLPEDPATALVTEMLVPAHYEVPEKKAKKKTTGTRKILRCKVVPDSSSEDTKAHSSNDNEEEEEENPLPQTEGEKKRKAAPSGEAKGPRREGPSLRTLHHSRLHRRGVATQGQAPSEFISIRIP